MQVVLEVPSAYMLLEAEIEVEMGGLACNAVDSRLDAIDVHFAKTDM